MANKTQEAQRDALRDQLSELRRQIAPRRHELRALYAADPLIRTGFSKGDKWTRDDAMRGNVLDGLGNLADRLTIELGEILAQAAALQEQLCECYRNDGAMEEA